MNNHSYVQTKVRRSHGRTETRQCTGVRISQRARGCGGAGACGLPDDETLYDLSELFRVFGDSTRIKILYVLFESELCVCDIARLLNLTQSAVSHQLRILKASNLVRFRREGKTVFYSLDDDHVRSVLALGMEHVLEK